jgi:hypothetical protein
VLVSRLIFSSPPRIRGATIIIDGIERLDELQANPINHFHAWIPQSLPTGVKIVAGIAEVRAKYAQVK